MRIELIHLVLTEESRRDIFDGLLFINTGSNKLFFPAIRKTKACMEEHEAELYNKRYGTNVVPGIVTIQENDLDYCLKIIN